MFCYNPLMGNVLKYNMIINYIDVFEHVSILIIYLHSEWPCISFLYWKIINLLSKNTPCSSKQIGLPNKLYSLFSIKESSIIMRCLFGDSYI